MVEVVATSEGIIPLKRNFNDSSYPPEITPEARALARKHGFTAKEYGSDILLVADGYEIKISNVVECFKLVRVPYSWWEPCYPGYSIHKERVSTPPWVADFSQLLLGESDGRKKLDSLA
jgi:hypothetical protein